MPERCDAIVLGAGQNGLAAAARLGAAGLAVIVLERRHVIGGLCAPVEVHPGYRLPGILHDEGRVEPSVVSRLGLERHGLELRNAPRTLIAEADGPGIAVSRDVAATGEELASRSPRDAEAYGAYRELLATIRPLVERVMTSPPPPLSPSTVGELWEVARQGIGAFRLGRRATLELMRVAPMCVADCLNERFETPLLVEGLAAPAVVGTWSGPWSAGTATNLLLAEATAGRYVTGGPAAFVAALERAARSAGAEIRTGAEVTRIRLAGGRAAGVTLASGEELEASLVVSSIDPKSTFLRLVAPATLPIAVEREIRNVRSRGTAAQIHLALSGPLELAARPGETFESIRVGGGHVDELERAFDAVKYRRVSTRPHLEMRVPSVADPKLAPPDHHVASVRVSYAPHDLEGGWTPERREELLDSVLRILERHVTDLPERIVAHEVLTPPDLELCYGVTGGQLQHVEPSLDQLLVLRPTASAARYATPVPGLFLGGSGSHGGGGMTCTAGLLAADAALSR